MFLIQHINFSFCFLTQLKQGIKVHGRTEYTQFSSSQINLRSVRSLRSALSFVRSVRSTAVQATVGVNPLKSCLQFVQFNLNMNFFNQRLVKFINWNLLFLNFNQFIVLSLEKSQLICFYRNKIVHSA